MGLGGGNPLPFHIGGGPTPSEALYNSFVQMVGIGGSAEEETLDADWRWARSRGIVAGFDDERAMLQIFPHLATDFIELFEDILGIYPAPGACDEERRQIIKLKWVRLIDASLDGIETELQSIDSRFSVFSPFDADNPAYEWSFATTTIPGRLFEDVDPEDADACGPAFTTPSGVRTATAFPNFSSRYVVKIIFDLGRNVFSGTHTGGDGEAVLTDSTKSWTVDALIGFYVYNITDGSFAVITDNDATTVTATLAGGTDDDWDTDDEYTVVDTGLMTLSAGQQNILARAGALLNEILPAWTGYQISTSIDEGLEGFILDVSLLDIGAFNV